MHRQSDCVPYTSYCSIRLAAYPVERKIRLDGCQTKRKENGAGQTKSERRRNSKKMVMIGHATTVCMSKNVYYYSLIYERTLFGRYLTPAASMFCHHSIHVSSRYWKDTKQTKKLPASPLTLSGPGTASCGQKKNERFWTLIQLNRTKKTGWQRLAI